MDISNDGGDKGDQPGKLCSTISVSVYTQRMYPPTPTQDQMQGKRWDRRTVDMERVERAKGSPIMLSKLNLDMALVLRLIVSIDRERFVKV